MVPRTKSAVILLTNTEHLPADSLHSTILQLLLEDQKKQGPPNVPKVNGPRPRKPHSTFLHQMQAGKLDRDKLGEEFASFSPTYACKRRHRGSRPWANRRRSKVQACTSAGAWRSPSIHFKFKTADLGGLLYRTPDGKIQQFLIRKQ